MELMLFNCKRTKSRSDYCDEPEIENIVGYFKQAKSEIERIMFQWFSMKGFEKDQLLEVAKNWLEQSKPN
jgi:hypothetical protein